MAELQRSWRHSLRRGIRHSRFPLAKGNHTVQCWEDIDVSLAHKALCKAGTAFHMEENKEHTRKGSSLGSHNANQNRRKDEFQRRPVLEYCD